MFSDHFSHYLSYGATDQQTVRELSEYFDGLIVPGTIAAFQRHGTGGFVLSLSASESQTPYVIDPRFPLFQQALPQPKVSHESLAEVFGDEGLISSFEPRPEDFPEDRIESIAAHWKSFHSSYTESAGEKFNKYAQRLGQALQRSNARGPSAIIPPYFFADGPSDAWWQISKQFYDKIHEPPLPVNSCTRVVAARSGTLLQSLLLDLEPEKLIVWVSGLNEFSSALDDLISYARAIQSGAERGHVIFGLYGGFFSVLLGSIGLTGACHGIGFGEHRDYLELSQSGPPPARFYLPRLHRYVPQELAYQLWAHFEPLAACGCNVCNERSPIDLDYHALMQHSVLVRSLEIEEWGQSDLASNLSRLTVDYASFVGDLGREEIPEVIRSQAMRYTLHFEKWMEALSTI